MKQNSILQIFIISLLVLAQSEVFARDLRPKSVNPWSHGGIAPVLISAQRPSKAYDPFKKLNEPVSIDSYNSYGKHHSSYQRPYKFQVGQHSKQDYKPTALEHLEVIPSALNSSFRYEDQIFDRMLDIMFGKTGREEQPFIRCSYG